MAEEDKGPAVTTAAVSIRFDALYEAIAKTHDGGAAHNFSRSRSTPTLDGREAVREVFRWCFDFSRAAIFLRPSARRSHRP
jgi:hypothetical protein